MKSRILLIDDSLTVQKVVSLTLDKNSHQVYYAKGRADAVKQLNDHSPHLVLLSDQVKELNASTFPKEVEAWLGRDHDLPAMVLITGQDIKEMRHFSAVLKKPFTPQALLDVVAKFANKGIDSAVGATQNPREDYEEERLERAFNDTFKDEKSLTMETLEDISTEEVDDGPTLLNIPKRVESPGELWGVSNNVGASHGGARASTNHDATANQNAVMGAEDSMAYKAVLENKVRNELEGRNLDAVVDRLLGDLLPPIVERLVQERLDKLLHDQEKLVDHS